MSIIKIAGLVAMKGSTGPDEARLLLWSGAIPLELELDASEVAGLSPPQPFYVSRKAVYIETMPTRDK